MGIEVSPDPRDWFGIGNVYGVIQEYLDLFLDFMAEKYMNWKLLNTVVHVFKSQGMCVYGWVLNRALEQTGTQWV